jgi:hypothetical protein
VELIIVLGKHGMMDIAVIQVIVIMILVPRIGIVLRAVVNLVQPAVPQEHGFPAEQEVTPNVAVMMAHQMIGTHQAIQLKVVVVMLLK